MTFHFKIKFFNIKKHKGPQTSSMSSSPPQFHSHTTILHLAFICKPGNTLVEKQVTPIPGVQGKPVAYSDKDRN